MSKDLSIIVFGRVCQIFIMLASIRLLTTLLSEEQVGNYYLIMALVAFFNLVLLNPPGMYFSRHLLSWKNNNNVFNVLIVFLALVVLLSIVGVFISIAIYYVLDYSERFRFGGFLFFILCIFWVSVMHRNMLSGINIFGLRKAFVLFTLTTLVMGLCFSVSFVTLYDKSALTWLYGIVLSEFLMLGVVFKLLVRGTSFSFARIRNKLDASYIRRFLSYAAPIAATTFLMWGQNFSYRFIVEHKYSIEMLSYIAVGMTVASSIFGAIENISMQYYNPIFLKDILGADKKQRAASWNRMANILIPIYILCVFYVISMSPFLVKVLVAEKFHSVYLYTMIGAVIEFFRVNSNVLNFVAQSELQTKSTVKPYMLGFCFTLCCMLVIDVGEMMYMIPAIIAFSYFMVCIYLFISMKRLLDIRIEIPITFIALLLVPFSIPYIFEIIADSMFFNLVVLGVFGFYLLFAIWVQVKRRVHVVDS